MDMFREGLLIGRRGLDATGVFSPKVAPDPTMQRRLEDRVKQAAEDLVRRKRASVATRTSLQVYAKRPSILHICG